MKYLVKFFMNSSRKKLLFLIPSYQMGGAERVLLNLVKKMDFDIFDITVCAVSSYGSLKKELPKEIRTVSLFQNHQLSRVSAWLGRKLGMQWQNGFLLNRVLIGRYDMAVCCSDGALTDILLFASHRFDKVCSWVHSCYKSQPSLAKIYTSAFTQQLSKTRYVRINSILCASNRAKEEFCELFGLRDKAIYIPNIISTDELSEKAVAYSLCDWDENVVNLVAIGRLVSVKAYDKLLRSFAWVLERGYKVHLRIIGSGPQFEEWRILGESLGVSSHIEWLGHLDNPYPYLKRSDLMVISSDSEALPTVMLEAMYFGVPVLTTPTNGGREISREGKYAFLTGFEIDRIAHDMESLVKDKALRDHFARQGLLRSRDYDDDVALTQFNHFFLCSNN